MELATGTAVDRYTIEGVLGEGGMAIVYLCRHTQLGTRHALKVLTMSSRAIRERLVQEGQVQANLRHPNIVAVSDVIMINRSPGLVMEYIDGPSLDGLLTKERLTFEQADVLVQGILAGVQQAHSMGLIHRDLKPANILLAIEGQVLVPKIADFGLAKLVDSDALRNATRTGSTMGTPHYMSPEQVEDSKHVDHRTDVFACGAILYEMVTGERAFNGDSLYQIFGAVAEGRFRPPRDLCPNLPDRMEAAILGALTSDREARIQSAEQLWAVWSGREIRPVSVAEALSAGPFSTAFMDSVRSISTETVPVTNAENSNLTFGVPDADPEPLVVETVAVAPAPVPPAAPVAAASSVAPVPDVAPVVSKAPVAVAPVSAAASQAPGSDALDETSSARVAGVVALGGGAVVVLGGLVLLALLGVGGTAWYLTTGGALVPSDDAVAEVPAAVGATDDPTPVQPEPPEPDAVDPEPAEAAPVVPPRPPGPGVPSPVAVVPVPTPVPAAVEQPVAEPLPVPDTPTPPPTPVAPVVEEVPGLDARGGGARENAIKANERNPALTATFVKMARTDSSPDVRVVAFKAVCTQWELGIGDRALQEKLLVDSMQTGIFSEREATIAYGKAGRDLTKLQTSLAGSGFLLKAAVTAIVSVGQRTNQQAAARQMLENRLENTSGPSALLLRNGLSKL